MKWFGIALLVISGFFLYLAWYDTREGPAIRFLCYVGIAAGGFLFFEGLKREIIAALRNPTATSNANATTPRRP